ncbi:uroporphyrinogen decarboxylase family protein [Thermodesulfobacteriota bacterium]
MKELTGRERVVLAYKKEFPDRVPTQIIGNMIGRKSLGISGREMVTNPQKMAGVIIESWNMIHSDVVSVGVRSLLMAQAVGNECDFDERGLLHAKSRILEDKSNLNKLTLPVPQKDHPLPANLEVCDRVGSALAKNAGVMGSVSLPWTVAVQMRGMEQWIYDTVDDPEFVHAVMRFCTDYTKILGTAVLETVGEEVVGLYTSDPSSGCSVISPKIYREFVRPYHKEVVDYFKSKDTLITFHICGFLDPIMEDIVSTGLDGISIDEKSSLKKMFETSGGKLVIIGNIPPLLFINGTREEIEAAVKTCLETSVGQKGYILASGCAIPPQTPLENLEYFMEAAKKYGRYNAGEQS